MNKIFGYFASLLICSVAVSACKKDFLDTIPTTSLSDGQIETSLTGVEYLINGLHNMTYYYRFGHRQGSGHNSIGARLDLMGDDVINTIPSAQMHLYRWVDSSKPNGTINWQAWDYYYTLIQHANKALTALDAIGKINSTREKHLRGSALVFRAFAYHNLVQLFGKRYVAGTDNAQLGVVLRLLPTKEPLPRSTVGQVYAQIDRDLAEAIELLKDVPDSRKKNDIRYATACGVAARVALTKADYPSAERYAQLAKEHSGAKLQVGRELLDGFSDYRASEWIWGYVHAKDQNNGYLSFAATIAYNVTGYSREGKISINRSLYDKMGANDVRRKWWVALDQGDVLPTDADPPYFDGGTSVLRARWEITGAPIKFRSKGGYTGYQMDALVLRLGELYYIMAEAQARQGKEVEARATLEEIMKTRDEDYTTTLAGADLIDEILRNRRLDLWLEGQGFFDMKRLSHVPDRVSAKNFDILATLKNISSKEVGLVRNTGVNAEFVPKTADSKYWEFAIPYNEIKANPSIQINPL